MDLWVRSGEKRRGVGVENRIMHLEEKMEAGCNKDVKDEVHTERNAKAEVAMTCA